MTSTQLLEIRFDSPNATYFNGQHVTGSVVVHQTKEKRLKGIELTFTGVAEVFWTSSNTDSSSDSYREREIYFHNSLYVVGGPDEDILLPMGQHNYPFCYILPSNLPSSFEGICGHVRYSVNAVIRDTSVSDHTYRAVFTVLNPLDLNSELHIQEPVLVTTEKYLCCGCCRKPPVTIAVSLPFTGFVPGQKCTALVEIDNPTQTEITVRYSLLQVVTYRAQCGKETVDRNTVLREIVGTVSRGGSMTSNPSLEIPTVPNSYLRNCNCIDVSYTYEIWCVFSGMHLDAIANVPIVIGSVPLRAQFSSILQRESHIYTVLPSGVSSEMSDNNENPEHSEFNGPNPLAIYPELPPPTYEECTTDRTQIRGREDNEYDKSTMVFAPKYLKYNFK